MSWLDRDDIWFGTALSRPIQNSTNDVYGGAYSTFAVKEASIAQAIDALSACLRDHAWTLTSLTRMHLACDYHLEQEAIPDGFERLVETALKSGVALGAFHTFPKSEQSAS